MKKLTKRQALKEFNKGRTICLCSSKLNEQVMTYSPWFQWFTFTKETCDEQIETFETVINSFSYYNCNKELGLRVNYYIY